MSLTEMWNGRKVEKVEMPKVTAIQCQHPTCKSHPHLRVIYWVDDVPIGCCCINKAYRRLDDFFQPA